MMRAALRQSAEQKSSRTQGQNPHGNPMLDLAKVRLLMVALVLSLAYLAVCLRLVDLTLFRDTAEDVAAMTAADGTTGTEGSAAPPRAIKTGKALRGTILDRNGDLVATSLKMASVYADATVIADAPRVARDLAAILKDQRESDLAKKLSSGKKFIWLARNITPKQEYAINALGHPGISFQYDDKRIYPHENLTAHLVGYTDVDGKGISGVEKSFDRQLAEGEEPVRLSLDLRIQHLLHRELSAAREKFSAKAAIGGVMDIRTGEIIAAVSLPDFNPYHPGNASADARFNRFTLGVFEMGSTFKLFSTAAALDSGKVGFGTYYDTSEPLKYGRFRISDYHPEKRAMSVPEIFIFSSNIGTAKMALTLGNDGLRDFYEKMGFLEPVPVNFTERGKPLYPKGAWKDITTITTAFGHGVAVSPLHLLRAAAALVNGGVTVRPTFVIDPDMPKYQGEQVIKPETSKKLRQLLELVVADGTGSKARVDGYNVGGKTGTAEKTGAGGYNKSAVFSSFLGFYPMKDPRYVVLAIMDEPKPTKDTYGYATGGWTAAPVVAKVIEQMGPLYDITPDFTPHDIVAEMAAYLKKKAKH